MARKSAASTKPKKTISEQRTPEEYFDEAKSGLLMIVESYEKNSTRVDNIFNMMIFVKELGINDIDFALKIALAKKATYSRVKEIINSLVFDKFMKTEDDPFVDLLEYMDCTTGLSMQDLLLKNARFEAVRPFGEKIEQLRITLKEMKESN